jgi:hypothetical protein
MATFNAHGVVRMEGKINALLQKSLDGEWSQEAPNYSRHYPPAAPAFQAEKERLQTIQ